ncbi:hypothetical protein ABZO31_00950 [Streptomyces sp. HUAS MG47]
MAAAEVFAQGETLPADSLRARVADTERAAQVATLVVAATDGAIALCRASRDTAPLDRTAAQLRAVVADAVDG